jgi:hypothetical protein
MPRCLSPAPSSVAAFSATSTSPLCDTPEQFRNLLPNHKPTPASSATSTPLCETPEQYWNLLPHPTPAPKLPPSSPSPLETHHSLAAAHTIRLVNPLGDQFSVDYYDPMDASNSASRSEIGGIVLSPHLNSELSSSPVFRKSPRSPISVIWLSPDQRPPSKEERKACYSRLDDDLGPPRGIQQLVGSYQAYMKEQSRLYYERLFLESGYDDGTDIEVSDFQRNVAPSGPLHTAHSDGTFIPATAAQPRAQRHDQSKEYLPAPCNRSSATDCRQRTNSVTTGKPPTLDRFDRNQSGAISPAPSDPLHRLERGSHLFCIARSPFPKDQLALQQDSGLSSNAGINCSKLLMSSHASIPGSNEAGWNGVYKPGRSLFLNTPDSDLGQYRPQIAEALSREHLSAFYAFPSCGEPSSASEVYVGDRWGFAKRLIASPPRK